MSSSNNWPSQGLPDHWNYGVTSDGRIFFIDDQNEISTWIHPTFKQPVQSGFYNEFSLPQGWQFDVDDARNLFFINHMDRTTTYKNPSYVTNSNSHGKLRHLMESPEQTPKEEIMSRKSSSRNSSKKHMTLRNYSYPVDMQGWIKKLEGPILKQWKRRWFVLSNYSLFCYKQANEFKMISSHILPGYSITTCLTEPGVPKRASFKIEHKNTKPIFLSCESTPEMFMWMEALKSAAYNNNNAIDHNGNYDGDGIDDKFKRSSSLGRQKKVSDTRANSSMGYRKSTNENWGLGHIDNNKDMSNNVMNNNGSFGSNLKNSRSKSVENIGNKWQSLPNRNSMKSYQDFNDGADKKDLYAYKDVNDNFNFDVGNGNNKNNNSNEVSNDMKMNNINRLPYGEQRSRIPVYRPRPQQDLTIDRRSSKRSFSVSSINNENYKTNGRNNNSNPVYSIGNNDSEMYNHISRDNNNKNSFKSLSSMSSNNNTFKRSGFNDTNLDRENNERYSKTQINRMSGDLLRQQQQHQQRKLHQPHQNIQRQKLHQQQPYNPVSNQTSHASYSTNHAYNNSNSINNKGKNINTLNNTEDFKSGFNNNTNGSNAYRNLSRNSINTLNNNNNNITKNNNNKTWNYNNDSYSQYATNNNNLNSNRNSNVGLLSTNLKNNRSSIPTLTPSNEKQLLRQQQNTLTYPTNDNLSIPSKPSSRNESLIVKKTFSSSNSNSNSNENVNNNNYNKYNIIGYNDHNSDINNINNNNYNTNNNTNNYNKNNGLSSTPSKPPHTNDFYKHLKSNENNIYIGDNTNNINRTHPKMNTSPLNYSNNNRDLQRNPSNLSITRSLSSYSTKSNNKNNYDNRNNNKNILYSTNNQTKINTNSFDHSNLNGSVNNFTNNNSKNNYAHSNLNSNTLQPLPHNFSVIREEPGMSDDMEPTKNLHDLKKKLATHTRLRLSISVQDLMGRSYEELVLFLIQLKRSQLELRSTCDLIRTHPVTAQNSIMVDSHIDSVEKQIEVTQPLINLLDNMLMMSSLYNGDALMYASQYKQNQLPTNELKPAKPMLEFNRTRQEMNIGSHNNTNIRMDSTLMSRLEDEVRVLRDLNETMQQLDNDTEASQQNRILIERALQEINQEIQSSHGNVEMIGQKELFENDLEEVYKDLYEKQKIMKDLQEKIKIKERKIEDIKQPTTTKDLNHHNKLNKQIHFNSNPGTFPKKHILNNETESQLENISSFLKESSQQKNYINNNLFSLKRSKSNAALDKDTVHSSTYLETDLDKALTRDLASKDDVLMDGINNGLYYGRESMTSNMSAYNMKQRSKSMPRKKEEFVDSNNNLNTFNNYNYNAHNNNNSDLYKNRNSNIVNTENYPNNNPGNTYKDNNSSNYNNNNTYNFTNNKTNKTTNNYSNNIAQRGFLVSESQKLPSVAKIKPVQNFAQVPIETSFVNNYNKDNFEFDEHTIEKSLFDPPPLVNIPQRYMADRESVVGDSGDDAGKEERLEQVRKLVAVHSLQDFSLNELGRVDGGGGVAERYQKELIEREQLLEKKKILAELVTERSRNLAGGHK